MKGEMKKEWSCWYNMVPGAELEDLVSAAMQGAARNLSAMVGRTISICTQRVLTVPLCQINEYAGHPESEMIGVYLLIEGDRSGQAVLMFTTESALKLVDLLMGLPTGSTQSLEDMERAALGEVGNMMVSGFLNDLVAVIGGELRPSPPAVMVDMLGVIMGLVASSVAAMSDDLLVIDASLVDAEQMVQARLWVLPAPETERVSDVCPSC